MGITYFYRDKHSQEKYFNKSEPIYSYIFLPWKNFKDNFKIHTSPKHLIQVDYLPYFYFFSQNFPTNTNDTTKRLAWNFIKVKNTTGILSNINFATFLKTTF